jgi:hypothetical protein
MTEHSFEQTAKDFIDYLRQAGKKERTLYTYSKDLVDPARGDAGQNRNLTAFDALQPQGDDQLAALLVKPASRRYPEDACVVFLDLFKQVPGQHFFCVGVSFHGVVGPPFRQKGKADPTKTPA